MRCPFLKESTTRYCQAAPDHKIPTAGIAATDELCSSPDHWKCAVAQANHCNSEAKPSCPYLATMLAQYCSAAPVVKFIPFTERESRCTTEAHRYCSLYLQRLHPARAIVELPEHLAYAANHMWIDIADDGTCHVGLDAFAARILGGIDGVRYLRSTGLLSPAVCVEVNGAELVMVFPRRILLGGCNAHLRIDPAPLEHDPYGDGWLFTGRYVDELAGNADLVTSPESGAWMQEEIDRMQHFVHDELQHTLPNGSRTVMDGGMFETGLAHRLDRDALLRLYSAFLAPHTNWRAS